MGKKASTYTSNICCCMFIFLHTNPGTKQAQKYLYMHLLRTSKVLFLCWYEVNGTITEFFWKHEHPFHEAKPRKITLSSVYTINDRYIRLTFCGTDMVSKSVRMVFLGPYIHMQASSTFQDHTKLLKMVHTANAVVQDVYSEWLLCLHSVTMLLFWWLLSLHNVYECTTKYIHLWLCILRKIILKG